MATRLNLGGLIVAVIGFGLTRFTVTLAIYEDPFRFLVAGVVPLLLGLGLAAFGVALVVADVDRQLVRSTATWCVIGTGAMAVLVVLTLLGSRADGMPALPAIRSQTYLSNFLIGGALGGTLTGLYAARIRRQRSALEAQANRLEVLHRILRHEVLNAVTVIRGYAPMNREETPDAADIIQRRADGIERTIEEVRYLTWSATSGRTALGGIDLEAAIESSVAAVRERHPDAQIDVTSIPGGLSVRATDRLSHVFEHLIENGIVHAESDAPRVEVSVSQTASEVSVAVRDDGPGLPAAQRTLLEEGTIDEFDNPGHGFGLNVVRFLVESFGGWIDTTVTENGSTVSVGLSRATENGSAGGHELSRLSLGPAHLLITVVAGLIAAVPYGLLSEYLGGSVAAIGVFYGLGNPVVGWLTHEFHSVVFALMFGGLLSTLPRPYRDHVPAAVALGAIWGVVLWAGAAGVVAPVWLMLLGFDVSVPNLTGVLLATHLAWGTTLGLLTSLGYRRLRAPVSGVLDRVR